MSWTNDAERAAYWHKRWSEEKRMKYSAIAEAKKAKERQLAAARLALKYKESDQAISRIAEAADGAPGYVDFGNEVLRILEELGYEIT